MQLRETVNMMNSRFYKDRFKAEYFQLKIRYEKLHSMLIKNEAGVLEFKPTCPVSKLMEQKRYMGEYLRMLEIRAAIEGIDL